MNQQSLKKLSRILHERYWEVVDGTGRDYDLARSLWLEKCESMGIEPHQASIEEQDYGQVFEESVVVIDPNPRGTWLEMNRETALKVLAIGLP